MTSLSSVQDLLNRPGELSAILISNRGDVFGGVDLTDTVTERYQNHSAVGGSGLKLVPIKREVVDQANETGSLFVSFFTTFGLSSIGVGLLLTLTTCWTTRSGLVAATRSLASWAQTSTPSVT